MQYQVIFQASAARQMRSVSREVYSSIIAKAESLALNPRPAGCEKLKGVEDAWRVRVGDYRIVYQIRDEVLMVLVVRIGHRKDVYRSR